MRIVLKPWFAVVVLLAAISVWALTVAPWVPLHERTAVSSRLEVRGDTYRRQTVISPPFSLSGGPSTIRILATPSTSASSASGALIANVSWQLIPIKTRDTRPIGEDVGLMYPALDTGAMNVAYAFGARPRGGFRMSVGATSNTAATITATVTELRGYWLGIPVFWIILLLGAVYIGLNVVLQRRQYPPNLIVIAPRRDSQ